MAKISSVTKTEKKRALVKKYAALRSRLQAIVKSPKSTIEERDEAYRQLRNLPRDSSATRVRNRCNLTGRARGYLRKFGLSRIKFRELALRGEIPGVVKASW